MQSTKAYNLKNHKTTNCTEYKKYLLAKDFKTTKFLHIIWPPHTIQIRHTKSLFSATTQFIWYMNYGGNSVHEANTVVHPRLLWLCPTRTHVWRCSIFNLVPLTLDIIWLSLSRALNTITKQNWLFYINHGSSTVAPSWIDRLTS